MLTGRKIDMTGAAKKCFENRESNRGRDTLDDRTWPAELLNEADPFAWPLMGSIP